MRSLVKDVWLLFGRLFPFPTRPGLRRVGDAGRSSPVLVTCNFDLTVRKVVRSLERSGIDAWLLVAPTKGINVWCAAGGGHFTTDTVVAILEATGIERLVDHRRLVLPQLSATGVNIRALAERTGWQPRFGPVDIRDIAAFLGRDGDPPERTWRRIEFPLADRFVMGTNLAFSSVLFLILPLLVASVWVEGLWWKSIPLLLVLGVLNSVLVFWLPGRPGLQKGLSLGVIVSSLFVAASQTVWETGPWTAAGWTAWILLLAAYLGFDMPSWSPLWRAEVGELLTGIRRTRVGVVPERCIGCALCATVCPTGVFELDAAAGKSMVVDIGACQACGACIDNCPKDAIDSNFRAGTCSCPTCAIIDATGSLGRPARSRESSESAPDLVEHRRDGTPPVAEGDSAAMR